jgi:DNA anti-recombination protein RmuC
MNNTEINFDNLTSSDKERVYHTINGLVHFKTANRKQYIKKKILNGDTNEDIVQLCFLLHNAINNRQVVRNDTNECVELRRENARLLNENTRLQTLMTKTETKCNERLNEIKNKLDNVEDVWQKRLDKTIDDKNQECFEYSDQNIELRRQLQGAIERAEDCHKHEKAKLKIIQEYDAVIEKFKLKKYFTKKSAGLFTDLDALEYSSDDD